MEQRSLWSAGDLNAFGGAPADRRRPGLDQAIASRRLRTMHKDVSLHQDALGWVHEINIEPQTWRVRTATRRTRMEMGLTVCRESNGAGLTGRRLNIKQVGRASCEAAGEKQHNEGH